MYQSEHIKEVFQKLTYPKYQKIIDSVDELFKKSKDLEEDEYTKIFIKNIEDLAETNSELIFFWSSFLKQLENHFKETQHSFLLAFNKIIFQTGDKIIKRGVILRQIPINPNLIPTPLAVYDTKIEPKSISLSTKGKLFIDKEKLYKIYEQEYKDKSQFSQLETYQKMRFVFDLKYEIENYFFRQYIKKPHSELFTSKYDFLLKPKSIITNYKESQIRYTVIKNSFLNLKTLESIIDDDDIIDKTKIDLISFFIFELNSSIDKLPYNNIKNIWAQTMITLLYQAHIELYSTTSTLTDLDIFKNKDLNDFSLLVKRTLNINFKFFLKTSEDV